MLKTDELTPPAYLSNMLLDLGREKASGGSSIGGAVTTIITDEALENPQRQEDDMPVAIEADFYSSVDQINTPFYTIKAINESLRICVWPYIK